MKTRSFSWDRYDGEPGVPCVGDLVYGPVAIYEVSDVRPVESLTHPDRFRLVVRRIGTQNNHTHTLAWAIAERLPDVTAWSIRHLNTPGVLSSVRHTGRLVSA